MAEPDYAALHDAIITLKVYEAGFLWGLCILTEDRSLEEQSALVVLAEKLKEAGYPNPVMDDGEQIDVVDETHADWKPQEMDAR